MTTINENESIDPNDNDQDDCYNDYCSDDDDDDKKNEQMKKFIEDEKVNHIKEKLWSNYKNSSLLIRGTDGQFPVNISTIKNNFFNTVFSNKDNIPFPDGGTNSSLANPWRSFMSNIGPAFSATCLSKSAGFQILWYVKDFVDPFSDGFDGGLSRVQAYLKYKIGSKESDFGFRNQGAYVINNCGLIGLNLFDANSNADIQGNTTIPLNSNLLGNRGTNVESFAAALPFVLGIDGNPNRVGTATSLNPDTNNTNKSYNPTLAVRNDGGIWSYKLITCTDTQVSKEKKFNICKIMSTLTGLKKGLWSKFMKRLDCDAPYSHNQILANLWDKNATTLAKNLQENYGSGFEIESYTFPPKYKPEDIVWLISKEESLKSNHDKYYLCDMASLNISTDAFNRIDWLLQIKNAYKGHNISTIIKNAYKNIYLQSIDPNTGWINSPCKHCELPITLITTVMLPKVNVDSAASDGNTGNEFLEYYFFYLFQGKNPFDYPYRTLKKRNFYSLGKIIIDPDEVSKPRVDLNDDTIKLINYISGTH